MPVTTLCCHEYGAPSSLVFEERDLPPLTQDQVQVRVDAAGVGFVDGLLIQGKYQVKPPLPYHPGSEFAGTVVATGANVTSVATGDRVMGLGNGTFAEAINLPAAACIKIPAAADPSSRPISAAAAAGMVVNYATALYGLRDCGKLQPGETLLVLGAAGGVGTAAITVAKALGATVIAAASSAAKLATASDLGADHLLDYSGPQWRDDLKRLLADAQLSLNLIYDPVGGRFAEPALRSLAPGGRFLVVGFASGAIPSIALNLALLKRCSIVGVDWGGEARADNSLTPRLLNELLDWMTRGKLTPPTLSVRPLSDARQALADQLSGKILGKLVFDCEA